MSNSTEVYWDARGVSLHTFAWALRTKAGRLSTVGKRGEDLVVPFRGGRTRQRKERESRTLALPFWVIPRNPDGTADPALTDEQKMYANWKYLADVFDVEGQYELTKRWYAADGTVLSATALAETVRAIEPTVQGGTRLEFVVEAFLADPYFYGAEETAPVGAIDVKGDVPTSHITLSMGPGRVTFPDGNWIEFTGTGTVEIDLATGLAKVGSQHVNGQIDRNKWFPEWGTLAPGAQTLTGTGTITYEPAYR